MSDVRTIGDTEVRIYGDAEQRAIDQIERCAAVEPGSRAVLCADNHVGYSQPIGGAVAYREHISPSGVGYDIGCGNKAVQTTIKRAELQVSKGRDGVAEVMDEITRRISFGMGRVNDEPVDHPVFDAIRNAA